MKKTIIFFIPTFTIGVLIGMLIYRNNWFPLSLYREAVEEPVRVDTDYYRPPFGVFYTKYTMGVPLFADRPYLDVIGNKELEDARIIQIPRHYEEKMKIDVDHEVVVYRVLSEANDNSFLDDWETTNIKVDVKGESSSHTVVVKKVFGKGAFQLLSGGPVSTSPIIIKSLTGSLPSSIKINNVLVDDEFCLTNCSH